MMLKLLDYQFKVTYKKGKELHVADTLSRAALKESFQSQQSDVFCMELVEVDLNPSNVTADTLERIQNYDKGASKQLSKFTIGDSVFVKPSPRNRSKPWIHGEVVN